jgi:hypothetical protein
MRTIPLSPIPAQTLRVILGGQDCDLAVYWRQERLYLDLAVGAAVVCRGAICQNGANILQGPSRFFRGSLHFFDTEGRRPPHFEGLNERFFLVYADEDETLPDGLRF